VYSSRAEKGKEKEKILLFIRDKEKLLRHCIKWVWGAGGWKE
jgi:hypothetical protein